MTARRGDKLTTTFFPFSLAGIFLGIYLLQQTQKQAEPPAIRPNPILAARAPIEDGLRLGQGYGSWLDTAEGLNGIPAPQSIEELLRVVKNGGANPVLRICLDAFPENGRELAAVGPSRPDDLDRYFTWEE